MTENSSLRPADRMSLLGFSEIVKIRNRVLALRQQGLDVLEFQGGEPFLPTPAFIKDAMKLALDENHTRYAPSSGIGPLLDAIVVKLREKNGIPVERDNVIVTSGGAHGLFCSFQTIVNPGDEVIFFTPYWTPIHDQVRFCGGVEVLVPWDEVRDGNLEESLRRRVTSKTRLIYVNSPANPTGDILRRSDLEAIARVAVERDLVVMSDEAYEDLVFGVDHVSIASLPGMFERTLSVFTLSKTFSMTGWRVGYVVAHATWMDPLRKLVLNTINGVSTPTQYAAAAAISDRSDYLDGIREQYRVRRDEMLGALVAAGFRCRPPAGAFYLFVDARDRLGNDSWKAMEQLLERTRIATVPGVVFGQAGEGHLRMSFSVQMSTIERAVEALSKL